MTPLQSHSVLSVSLLLALSPAIADKAPTKPIDQAARRELFVDHHLIERLQGVTLSLERPRDEGSALRFDKPWEGLFCGYATVLRDGDQFRVYYRGRPKAGSDGTLDEVTCCAESKDGLTWTKPELGLFEV